MRTVILHYHLFKNAGTSVDHILRQNFPDRWFTCEFPSNGGNNTQEVTQWIKGTPNGIAYSSHTMVGPLPQIIDVHIVPVVLLRDPVDRIRSAYHFERQQQADTKGAQLAKAHDLSGYVKARLAIKGDRQCRNFQTARLATMLPDPPNELFRAIAAARQLQQLGALGLVSDFHAVMVQLSDRISKQLGPLDVPNVRANRATGNHEALSSPILNQLISENGDDLALLDHIRRQSVAA
jgi:hypothetical protein